MGAQAQSEAHKFTPLTNAERCLICYGKHTESESEKGIGFELRNLKEIFIKSFGIPFLPHFSKYGLVYMCTRCHEEFLRVESLYDDLKCNESKFDAAREKLAFLIVDSIITSGYISNYIHGNAFDSIRYLVFKGWCAKFRKQGQVKKSSSNSTNKVTNEDDNRKQILEKILDDEKGCTLQESVADKAQIIDSSGSSSLNKIPPKETAINISPPKLESARSQQPVVSEETHAPVLSKKRSAITEVQDVKPPAVSSELPDKEGQVTASEGEQGLEVSSSSETIQNGMAKAAEPKLDISVKSDEKKSAVTSTSVDANTVEPGTKQNKNVDKTNITTDSVTVNNKETTSGISIAKVDQLPAKKLASGTKQPPDNPPPRRVALGPNAGQAIYVTTSDGRKLIPQTFVQNPKLIFVKKDPVTGRMIQVPRPNQTSVKGKLNGKDVIIRTAASSAAGVQPASSIFLPDGTAVNVPFKGTAASSSTAKSTAVPKVATAASAVSSPVVPKIVSVQSIKKEVIKPPIPKVEVSKPPTPPPPQLEAQTVIQEPEEGITETSSKANLRGSHSPAREKNSQGTKSPKVLEESPEPRSSRSGRRIKRPFESSAWASGHEMDKLVSQSLKNGRHQFYSSPNKRQKADAKAPNISMEAADVGEPDEAQTSEEANHD